ncbi:MAG: hypothetical protein HC849_11755 [Oscillatoriales cyanobacterium RU_3_3]|nr:hypothetical protein [Oscillatoriales cyanobacterium RU_3_3]
MMVFKQYCKQCVAGIEKSIGLICSAIALTLFADGTPGFSSRKTAGKTTGEHLQIGVEIELL